MKGLVIAGTSSGVGKTTVASGIIGALKRRGLRVQPFKAGPDYIDPTYHSAVAGLPSRNLDGWLLSQEAVQELFTRSAQRADIAIIEGVMGLFDGRSGEGEQGSTAELAKLLGLPVVLVVDAGKMARSAAAIVLGYQRYDPHLELAGVILNNIGSSAHYQMAALPIQQATGLPVLGYLPSREDLHLPERHLGLIPTIEGIDVADYFRRLIAQTQETVYLEDLLRLTAPIQPWKRREAGLFPSAPLPKQALIALAQDKAFNFYYQDSLDLLEAWGAEIVPFSPLADEELPRGVDAIYIGGGFPELFAQELAENHGIKRALRRAAAAHMPIYAECGGLMYLGQAIVDFQGQEHEMGGILPARSSMAGARLTIGYRTVRALSNGPLVPQGSTVRGHEFHWSSLEREPSEALAAYELLDQKGRLEGYHLGGVWASYIHLHLGSASALAQNFVSAGRRWRNRQR